MQIAASVFAAVREGCRYASPNSVAVAVVTGETFVLVPAGRRLSSGVSAIHAAIGVKQ